MIISPDLRPIFLRALNFKQAYSSRAALLLSLSNNKMCENMADMYFKQSLTFYYALQINYIFVIYVEIGLYSC